MMLLILLLCKLLLLLALGIIITIIISMFITVNIRVEGGIGEGWLGPGLGASNSEWGLGFGGLGGFRV